MKAEKCKINNIDEIMIHVTKHAIDQYKEKMFSSLEEAEIRKILELIVRRGSYDCKRPGDAWSMTYNGISIVITKEKNAIVVITCLGNKNYKMWARKKEILPRYYRRDKKKKHYDMAMA